MRTKMSKVLFVVALCVCVAGLSSAIGVAGEPYPERPIYVVAPFPPGGVCDLHARSLAAGLEPVLKVSVLVINKKGAGGAVGMQYATTRKPDGYTIMVALSSEPYLHEVDKLFGRKPVYTPDDFIPIARLSSDPLVITVHSGSQWKTAQEFIADAKKRPGKIDVGSAGMYSVMHVAHELFIRRAGIQLNHIPYTGGGPTLRALLGRHIDCAAFGPSVVIKQLKAGTVRPLVVLGDKRLASMPDVPTAKELGYDAEFYIWASVFALKGTPDNIVKKLRDAVKKAVQTKEFTTAMKNLKTPIQYLDQPDFIKFLEVDGKRSRQLIRDIGRIE